MKSWIFIISAILVMVVSSGTAYSSPDFVVKKDVIYCESQGLPLKMDIYSPVSGGTRLPLIVYVHGGGWFSGDKSAGIGLDYIPELVSRGYLVASVNYRLAPRYQFPAQIMDIKCAVRFLRAQAEVYGLDPERIGVMGESAGGHLAALLGVTGSCDGFNGCSDYSCESSQVQAVVDMFGPSDLPIALQKDSLMFADDVFGTDDLNSEIIQKASPVYYVSNQASPFLIIHGDKDDQVPLEQSQELYSKLIASGVPASLIVVNNAGHEMVPVNGNISPTRSQISDAIADFFDRYLGTEREIVP